VRDRLLGNINMNTRFQLLLPLVLAPTLELLAQPVPHHFDGIAVLPNRSVNLSLNGSVSNMFSLPSTVANQFLQMFDLYAVEAILAVCTPYPHAR
jgi:hypothetical protein